MPASRDRRSAGSLVKAGVTEARGERKRVTVVWKGVKGSEAETSNFPRLGDRQVCGSLEGTEL